VSTPLATDPPGLPRWAEETLTKTTGGATSEAEQPTITHTSELVERHRITIPVGATGDNVVAVARLHAQAYARARGFDLQAGSLNVLAHHNTSPFGDPGYLGVSFDVVVGKGDISLDQSVPGVLDRWTWSAGAVEWWQRWLGTAEGKLISLVDGEGRRRGGRITGIRPIPGDPSAVSVEGEFVDGVGTFHGFGDPSRMPGVMQPGWQGPAALRGDGISVSPADQAPPWMRRADGDDTEGDNL
jgi:hypothetical protein